MNTTKTMLIVAGLVAAVAGAAVAYAQSGAVSAALAAGTVGEQADGYLGIKGSVSADVKSEVDAINIKRRAAYTDLAAKRGVTVSDVAAATGCTTLQTRVRDGQIYRLTGGAWQVKSGPIALPDYCANAG